MKCIHWSWDTLLIAAIVAVAGLCGQSPQLASAQAQKELEGPIVQIGPAKDEQEEAVSVPEAPPAPETPAYWIGLRGRGVEDPVLRTQLQLAEDMGVVVEDVVKDSPAEKAGLRQHDIVLRANGDAVDSMEVLQQHVQTGQDKPLELKVLRLGKEMTVTVTPEKRPEDFNPMANGEPEFLPGRGLLSGELAQMLGQMQGGQLPGGMRVFGPGVLLNDFNHRFDFNSLPNGMSVSISREKDGPAKITVKKGEKTWNVSSDDAKAIAELPEDVRNFVSGMLNGQVDIRQELGNLDLEAELRHWLPKNLGNLPGMENFKAQEDELKTRMNQLEQQLQELQKKLEADETAN